MIKGIDKQNYLFKEKDKRLLRERRISKHTNLNQINSRFKDIREALKYRPVMKIEKITDEKTEIIQYLDYSMEELVATAFGLKLSVDEIFREQKYTSKMEEFEYLKHLAYVVYDISTSLSDRYYKFYFDFNKECITQNNCIDLAETYYISQELMLHFTEFHDYVCKLILNQDTTTSIKRLIEDFYMHYDNVKIYLFQLLNIDLRFRLSHKHNLSLKKFFNTLVNISDIEIV